MKTLRALLQWFSKGETLGLENNIYFNHTKVTYLKNFQHSKQKLLIKGAI
jgi:hypothetical protein